MKRIFVWGNAGLWLLDAALQAQPRMFTLDFVSNIMKPSVGLAPSFLGGLANWTLTLISPNIGEWNWFFTLIQFAIAVLLLTGLMGHKEKLIKIGLVISILWGTGVWIFGEGTGGVFTGNGTLLTGAPGSAFLYILIAVLYFLPDSWWNLNARFCLPRDAVSIVFFYGCIAQVATPTFWQGAAVSGLIQEQSIMAPSWMIGTMHTVVNATSHFPALWNVLLACSFALVAWLLFGKYPKKVGFVVLGIVLLVIWYWGQAFGGIFSGMGTDPNTPPLFALMCVPIYFTWYMQKSTGAHVSQKTGLSIAASQPKAS